jgi:3-hydroxyisobutyrate dehydrogenase-like beta-hydroxyacid dehydrogenase
MNSASVTLASINSRASIAKKILPEAPAAIESIRRVGVIGLGRMGEAFARNIIADGYKVVVYDRSEVRRNLLVGAGAEGVSDLGGLASCQVVLTSLPDDEVLSDIALRAGGLVEILAPGAIHVSMSTVSPGLSRRVSQRHEHAGQGYVAAPVLGNPDLASARKLFVIASGAASSVAQVSPLLARLGERLFTLGDDPGAANLIKLAGNVLTALTLESMGEVFALLRKNGVNLRAAFDVFTNSLFDGKVHKTYGGKIVEERYSPPGMTAPLAVKDLRLALAEAESASVPMPVTSVVHDRLIAMIARGWAELDWSALGLLAASDAGLERRQLTATTSGELTSFATVI